MPSDVEIFRRLRALEAEVARLRTLEFTPRTGTWTPIFSGTTTGGTISYTRQNGRWVRIGAVVIVWCNQLLVSTVTVAPTGTLVVDGFPYTARLETNFTQGAFLHQFNNLNLAASVVQLTMRIAEGNTYADFAEGYDDTTATVLDGSAIRAGSFVSFTAIYEVDG